MKNVILFFLICIIATFAFFGALSMDNPFPGFIVAFGVWILYLWRTVRK